MKVELLTHTPDPLRLMYAQTRGTTTSKGFGAVYVNPERFFPRALRERLAECPECTEKLSRKEMVRLVTEAIRAGHLSVTRGATFTFSVECSRSAGRQLLRHTVGVAWEEMSQRYVKLAKRETVARLEQLIVDEDFAGAVAAYGEFFVIPPHIAAEDSALAWRWFEVRLEEIEQYVREIEAGVPAEDARENLPNCTKTQMISTWTFEALKNFLAKRLCTRAQLPARTLAKEMRKQVLGVVPWAGPDLTVQCLPACICPEARPDGCPLLAENGGNVLRKEQAYAAIQAHVRQLKALPALTPTP